MQNSVMCKKNGMGETLIPSTSPVDSEKIARFKWDTLYITVGKVKEESPILTQ